MKFTLSLLKDHLDTDAPLDEICERLTMIGLEVESVAGQLLGATPLPNQPPEHRKRPQPDRLH